MREKPLILVVDDSSDFREIISTKLSSVGFEIQEAKNPDECLKKAEEFLPDLILMDIHLKAEKTGVDLAMLLKEQEKTRNLKISFLTSLKDPWPAMRGGNEAVSRELGMQGFIGKEEDLDEIVKKVKSILIPIPHVEK